MGLTIFSKHNQNDYARISYYEFMQFRIELAKAFNQTIGYCYSQHAQNFTKNKEIADHFDKMFEGIFEIANSKAKQIMLFLCKKDTGGSCGKKMCNLIVEYKEIILQNAENYQKKPFEMILYIIEKSKDYGIRWV